MLIRGYNNTGSLCNATVYAREKSLSLIPLPLQFLSDILVTGTILIKLPCYLPQKAQKFIALYLEEVEQQSYITCFHLRTYLLLLDQ